jgi:hypothetical protein
VEGEGPLPLLPTATEQTLPDVRTNTDEVELILSKTKINKSPGLDNIHPIIINKMSK